LRVAIVWAVENTDWSRLFISSWLFIDAFAYTRTCPLSL
jgi:hypothetical protein